MPNTNNPSYEDPNLSAGTAGQLLLTIPNKADVPKVLSWIVDVKKGKVLHQYTFEPVILLVWLDPKEAGKLGLWEPLQLKFTFS